MWLELLNNIFVGAFNLLIYKEVQVFCPRWWHLTSLNLLRTCASIFRCGRRSSQLRWGIATHWLPSKLPLLYPALTVFFLAAHLCPLSSPQRSFSVSKIVITTPSIWCSSGGTTRSRIASSSAPDAHPASWFFQETPPSCCYIQSWP